jgi:hypothetical protein
VAAVEVDRLKGRNPSESWGLHVKHALMSPQFGFRNESEGIVELTKENIEKWLLDYAWLGDADYQRREVECIMSQDDWQFVDARAEKFAGQASGEELDLADDTTGFALSSLYECHADPHIETCPHFRGEVAVM